MISIKKHLAGKHQDVQSLLDETVNEMWLNLNPTNGAGSLTRHALITRTQGLRTSTENKKHVDKVGLNAAKRHLNYIQYLENPTNLRHIISAKPTEFENIITNTNALLNEDDLFIEKKGKIETQPFGKLLLKDLFNYESYRSSDHCHKRYKKLGFDQATCPYCNENPVRIIKVEKPTTKTKILMLYDIDHFYPKHTFPYLALSFYNHIPSCKTCNQTFKGSKPFRVKTHLHPYQQCFDETYTFKFNHSILSNQPIEKLTLENISSFPDQLASTLQLQARYSSSTKLYRTSTLIDILSKRTHLLNPTSTNTEERKAMLEMLQAFGVVQKKEDILSNLYGKLYRDIVKMFDVRNTINLT